jgi:ubiquinone/menaquinone biosynthesis C-methylase UbiE
MLFYRCTTDKVSQNMTQSLHPAAQKGFGSAAQLYQQVRPSYPQNIVLWLQDHLQVHAQSKLLDLGAGTGKFLPYLQQITDQVTAVEPISEMLAELQQQFPTVHTIQAYSHEIPVEDASFDAVFCAQSFHWFSNTETLQEIYRILKPNAYLVLVWNQRDISVDWVNALAEYIAPFEGDTPRYHSQQWKLAFENQELFQLFEETTFEQKHRGTVEDVVSKRLLSTSFIAAMSQNEQQQHKIQFERIVQQYTGLSAQDVIDFPYVTHVYVFQKNPSE